MKRALWFSLLVVGCADGGVSAVDASRDGTTADTGADTTPDGGVDAGFDAGSDAGFDAGPGEVMTCGACEVTEDCADSFYCVDVGGGRACLPSCNPDIPSCPPRFNCVVDFMAGLPSAVCAPVGERCCVDGDEDLHGTGVGCLGIDCDDEDPETNESATEVCDAADNDCDGEVDDGDPAMLCIGGAHVATTVCETGGCQIATCEPGFGDCDTDATNGCEVSLDSPIDCGACATACAPMNATPDCGGGVCRIDRCGAGFGDCNSSAGDGCEVALDSTLNCGGCGIRCTVPSAVPGCDGSMCTIASCNPGFADCDGSPLNGCETSTTSNANCGGCGMVCAPSHGVGECSTGSCRITSCATGWDDCDGDPTNGCERNLRTLTDCGSCGAVCTRPGGMASCASGSCETTGCSPLLGDCNGVSADGCETSLATTSNCGGCGLACSIPGGTGSCPGGICTVNSCNPGVGNCDGFAANGCESPLNTLTNCGGCGVGCARANAGASCSTGSCRTGTCNAGFGNCDGNDANGCERALNTLTSCGGCGVACTIPNSAETCSSGSCSFVSCNTGFSTCDGNTSNGCEVGHAAVSGSCGAGTYVGAYDGDRSCGFICGSNTGWDNFATQTGRTSRWFRATIREDSDCPADIEHRIRLTSPPGADYDLYVYRACGTVVGSSTSTSANDEVILRINDSTGSSDTSDYFVEVRYYSGASCNSWTLNFDGHNC